MVAKLPCLVKKMPLGCMVVMVSNFMFITYSCVINIIILKLFVGYALIDLLQKSVEDPPIAKTKILCRHPFDQKKRAFVVPSAIKPLYKVIKP